MTIDPKDALRFEVEHQQSERTGALGWPLVPSKHFPGELTLACPECGSTNITLTSVGAGVGSGYRGAHRMGDNFRPVNRCNNCKHQSVGGVHVHVVNGGVKPL